MSSVRVRSNMFHVPFCVMLAIRLFIVALVSSPKQLFTKSLFTLVERGFVIQVFRLAYGRKK